MIRSRWLLAGLLAIVPLRLGAQAAPSHPALDSASAARAAWARMNAARRAGDLFTAVARLVAVPLDDEVR